MKIKSMDKARTLKALGLIQPELADMILTLESDMIQYVEENLTLETQLTEVETERDELRERVEKCSADTERLDWLAAQEQEGSGLLNDDFGRWAVSGSGFQNITDDDGVSGVRSPISISTTFFVDKADWCNDIREAIDVALRESK